MSKYKFDVSVVEEYNDTITIDAPTKEEAIKKLKQDLNGSDLSERKNTYVGKLQTVMLGQEEIDI